MSVFFLSWVGAAVAMPAARARVMKVFFILNIVLDRSEREERVCVIVNVNRAIS